MKYIDADLLRKDIDNWKETIADAVGEYSDGVRFALEHFTFVLDSLQQEQPDVDLENEIHRYFNPHGMALQFDRSKGNTILNPEQLINFARHFYELDLKAKEE